MPRKGLKPREKRGLPAADFKCDSTLVSRFINKLIKRGKKVTAERIMYDAFEIIKEKIKQDPLSVFNKAVENIRPLVELKSRRVGGATYQVPCEVRMVRSSTLGMRWIIGAALAKKGRPMADKIADEIIQAFKKEGTAFKKREDTHKMAEANRAFAHYRW
jgi:small subunit ribosomal protein S7